MDLRSQLFEHNDQRRLFGRYVQQSAAGIHVYEQLLSAHADRLNWIVEIGTGQGQFSLYLAVWAQLQGWPFLTIDDGRASHAWSPTAKVYQTLRLLGAYVVKGDVFTRQVRDMMFGWIAGDPGALFCDGGFKRRELQTFGPKTYPGSLIVVHDVPVEITPADIDAVRGVERYEPWHSQSIELGTKAAILCRVE